MLVVVDQETQLLVSGTGDVIAPSDGIIAIGSGGPFALAAARALLKCSNLSAREIVTESLTIAGQISVYSNTNL